MFSYPVLVFRLEGRSYAVRLEATERVVAAVDIVPLPAAPAVILGIFDFEGEAVPVFNVRRRFGLPEREILPTDHFVIVRTGKRKAALPVDETVGVEVADATRWVDTGALAAQTRSVPWAFAGGDGLVIIHDLETFLAPEETAALDTALVAAERRSV